MPGLRSAPDARRLTPVTPEGVSASGGTLASLTFARPGGGRLQLGPAALNAVDPYVQRRADQPEAGGLLLGRHILSSRDVIVDAITIPTPDDRQSRYRFFRAARAHQHSVDRAWRESGGTCTYLGAWHTHPERDPSPSRIDRLKWRRKLVTDRYTDWLFFLILGTEVARAWEGRPSGRLSALTAL